MKMFKPSKPKNAKHAHNSDYEVDNNNEKNSKTCMQATANSKTVHSKKASTYTRKAITLGTLLMILLVFAIAGIAAHLTDSDSKINVFTVGDVDILLTETNFDSSQPMEKITPGQVIQKNPAISNVGANAAYVYMEVTIPKESFTDIYGNTITDVPLFTYSEDSNWVEMPLYEKDTGSSIKKVYYYNSILEPNTNTSELFQTVTVANFPSFDDISAERLNIDINAYAIQSVLPAVEEGENEFVKAYGIYVEENYKILVFDSNGGTGTMSNQLLTAGETTNLTTNSFTKERIYFLSLEYRSRWNWKKL